jgi:signal transduction histidine kinase
VALLSIGFIAACGLSHLVGLGTLWMPAYGFEGLVKLATALVSILASISLWRLMPQALAMPSHAQLHRKNVSLEAEIARRAAAEGELQQARLELERRVAERTQELARANAELERRNAELADANLDLERFAYVASHDLKAPVRGCSRVLSFLREDLADALTGEQAAHLDAAVRRLQHMDRMLKDLLGYARLGQNMPEQEWVDVEHLLEETVALLEPPPGFEVVIERPLPPVRSVPGLVGVVFRNLLANALRHHDRSDGRVVVRTAHQDGFVAFIFEDDGPGIPPGMKADVFRPYHKAGEGAGSGMGLAFVKRAVERGGGEITLLDRGDARGTAFRVAFPAAKMSAALA